MRKTSLILTAIGAVAVQQPAMARDAHVEAIESIERAPAGATASIGLSVPLGGHMGAGSEATYGFTMRYGHRFDGVRPNEPIRTRSAELLQLNFDEAGARDVQMANFTLTDFGREDVAGRTLNLGTKGAKKGFPLLLVIVGAGVAGYLIASSGDDDEDGTGTEADS